MTNSKTNEQALEAAIEKALTGQTQEEIRENGPQFEDKQGNYGTSNGFWMGNAHDFNAQFALDETRFWHFLETTQNAELQKLQRSPDRKGKILEHFDGLVKKNGLGQHT
ncbi:hypothetical protein CLV98_1128 [Dyadobacter jejuensis]|uniref:Uncharacterized protein n=1 Tax=Dyadobacter jejuensis TaxID=1082580 RepID=A0A316AG76_9BACT|nr:hypothetical protein [Dyadobacter jejuensis]PWJ55914.1 hypothetical protein CLV98_1128 [Dyadobacter jejuensis]